MRIYKIGKFFYDRNMFFVSGLFGRLNRILFACDIPLSSEIHESCQLVHNGLGVVIHDRAIIGRGTKIYQNVTIGGLHKRGHPEIGEYVLIGCGACVLGGVKIGNGARIGANSVVLTDIPAFATAVGIPAKIIKINEGYLEDMQE